MYFKFTITTTSCLRVAFWQRLAFEEAMTADGVWLLAKVCARGCVVDVILEGDGQLSHGLFKECIYAHIMRKFYAVFSGVEVASIGDIRAGYKRLEDSQTRKRRPEDVVENLAFCEDNYEYNEFMVREKEKEARRTWAALFYGRLPKERRTYDLFFCLEVSNRETGWGKMLFDMGRIRQYASMPTPENYQLAKGELADLGKVEEAIVSGCRLVAFSFSNCEKEERTLLRGVCSAYGRRQAEAIGRECVGHIRRTLQEAFRGYEIVSVRLEKAKEAFACFGSKEELRDYEMFVHRLTYREMAEVDTMLSLRESYLRNRQCESIRRERKRRNGEYSHLRGIIKEEFRRIAMANAYAEDGAFPAILA